MADLYSVVQVWRLMLSGCTICAVFLYNLYFKLHLLLCGFILFMFFFCLFGIFQYYLLHSNSIV